MIDFNSLLPNHEEQERLQTTFERVRGDVERDDRYNDEYSEWLWNGKPIDKIPSKHKSFVYLITNKLTGKRYIGFKVSVSKARKTVKRKRVSVEVESDWKDYWSSSDTLNEDVKKFGCGNFIREIICLTVNKAIGKYIEAHLHFTRQVLTTNSAHYYNGIVNLRCNQQTLKQIDHIEWCDGKLLGDQLAETQYGLIDKCAPFR